jgi:dethiobiotin synthetase
MLDRIFIAATSQHIGKTTTTLGLIALLKQAGINVGFCKPVGQKFVEYNGVKVDKDAYLFSKMLNFDLCPEIHSPVVLAPGVTTDYLQNPSAFNFRESIVQASEILQKRHEVVVYEGTGHAGVGTIVDLSNAEVASMLKASIIMVVEAGLGNTIDRMNANLALFREKNVPILGVIINKVRPEKMDFIREMLSIKLEQMGIPLLGLLPYDYSMSLPIMETIQNAINGSVIFNEEYLNNRVEHTISGALVERRESDELEELKDMLLIVNFRRLDKAIEIIKEYCERHHLDECPFSGIVINGEGNFRADFLEIFENTDYINEHKIPLIATTLDTYGSAVRINKIEVKINTRTPWKVQKAIELIGEHVDWKGLFESK